MHYDSSFLSSAHARRLSTWMQSEPWSRETFQIFGRTMTAPRSLLWYGDVGLNYRYTGLDHLGTGWPDQINRIRSLIEERVGQSFNFMLANRYDGGSEYMGWHKDNEKGCAPTIASLSLGQARRFRIDHGDSIADLNLENGSLLVFDAAHRHTLPKTRKPTGLRINLTFRSIRQ